MVGRIDHEGEVSAMLPTRKSPPPPPLDGGIRVDDRARAAAADDFGHLVHRTPEGVLLPASEEDVAAAVRWAAEHGRTFAAQGGRHSVFGRGQAGGGVVADMRPLRTVHAIEDDRVVVDAGATWREVLAATLPRGLAPPGLPDYLDLSVGGTLIVGGVGSGISRFGVLSDNVLDLQVVTGRGERLVASPARNPGLFDAVRAGLGQVAVVTRATLRLVPAPRQVRRFLLVYPDLATMLADERLLAREHRFERVQGRCCPPPAAAGRSGSTSSRSPQRTRPTTTPCSPACPTTGRGQSRAPCPTSSTSTGWPRWSGCCDPKADGRSRIRG
jgi:cytokinin dehydrogenase